MNPIDNRPEGAGMPVDHLQKLLPEGMRRNPVPRLALTTVDPSAEGPPMRRFHRSSKEKRERAHLILAPLSQRESSPPPTVELHPIVNAGSSSPTMQVKICRSERPPGACSDDSKTKSRSPRAILSLPTSPARTSSTSSASPRKNSTSPSPRGGAAKKALKRTSEGGSAEKKMHPKGNLPKKLFSSDESLPVEAQGVLVDPHELVLKAMQASITGDPQQFDLLESESEIIAHDNELIKHLKSIGDKSKHGTSCNLNANIYDFCTSEAVAHFGKLIHSRSNLQSAVEEFAKRLFCTIRHPKILLGQSMVNFEELRAETWRYFKLQQCRTLWSTTLYTTLSQILEVTDIIEVVKIFESVVGKSKQEGGFREAAKHFLGSPRTCQIATLSSSKRAILSKLLESCFGSFKGDISDVLESLYLWNSDDEQKMLQEKLRKYIQSITTNLKSAESIPIYIHRLIQDSSTCEGSMKSISLRDIVRSLMPDAIVLADEIIINGTTIYRCATQPLCASSQSGGNPVSIPNVEISEDSLSLAADEQERLQRSFFRHLVKSILEACGQKVDTTIIKHLVNQFFSLVQRENEGDDFFNYGVGKSVFEPQFVGDLPFIGLLRLMTMSCFIKVRSFMQLLFPKMFFKSISSENIGRYEIKYHQGTVFEIKIDGHGSYEVFQRKKASIVQRTDLSAKPLAELDLTWGSAFTATGSLSELRIAAWKVCDLSRWVEFVEIWTKPNVAFDPNVIPAGYTYEPCCQQAHLGLG